MIHHHHCEALVDRWKTRNAWLGEIWVSIADYALMPKFDILFQVLKLLLVNRACLVQPLIVITCDCQIQWSWSFQRETGFSNATLVAVHHTVCIRFRILTVCDSNTDYSVCQQSDTNAVLHPYCGYASSHTLHVCATYWLYRTSLKLSLPPCMPPILRLASSKQWCWSGGRGILTELYLHYSTV